MLCRRGQEYHSKPEVTRGPEAGFPPSGYEFAASTARARCGWSGREISNKLGK